MIRHQNRQGLRKGAAVLFSFLFLFVCLSAGAEKKGTVNGNGINPSGYTGTLSDYVPERTSGDLNWDGMYINTEANGYGQPEYEARFANGKLRELEIEVEYSDGREIEVAFSGDRRILRAEYETENVQIYFDGSTWRDQDGNETEGPDLQFMEAYFDKFHIGTWYPYNTMSLVGLSLRDMFPERTNKWYQVVPVDLTKEGTTTYRTAVSNMFYFGDCTVTIQNGTVTTDYRIPMGDADVNSDCLMWFTDAGEITTEFLDHPEGKYQFGQPVSIREDLKGQDIALLFICNQVTYRDPLTKSGGRLRSYYRDVKPVRDSLKEYEALYERMQQNNAKAQ